MKTNYSQIKNEIFITQYMIGQAQTGAPIILPNNPSEQELYNYQLGCFIRLLDNKKESPNFYNDRSVLKDFKVIEYEQSFFDSRWCKGLAYGRGAGDINGLIEKYVSVLSVVGFLKDKPIVVDKNMWIIDGYQRLLACRKLGISFWYVRLDIDLKSDCTQ